MMIWLTWWWWWWNDKSLKNWFSSFGDLKEISVVWSKKQRKLCLILKMKNKTHLLLHHRLAMGVLKRIALNSTLKLARSSKLPCNCISALNYFCEPVRREMPPWQRPGRPRCSQGLGELRPGLKVEGKWCNIAIGEYPQDCPPQDWLLGGQSWGGQFWAYQSSGLPPSTIMYFIC